MAVLVRHRGPGLGFCEEAGAGVSRLVFGKGRSSG